MIRTITQGRQQGKPKERSKDKQPAGTKKKRLAVHVKTGHGDPARSNPRNHHKNAIKDQWPEQSHRGENKGNPKKGQKTNSPQEPRKRD
jgi:hypothetical protein